MSSALGALGANFNGKLTWINHSELRRVNATWIRGFIDMHKVNQTDPASDPDVAALQSAVDAGFRVILSLKWDYADADFPDRGAAPRVREGDVMERLLHCFLGRVDILVVGNEPFIEARQRGPRLCDFYEDMVDRAIAIRRSQNAYMSTRLYVGALNRLDLPVKRTPAIERFIACAAARPDVEGVDLHPHMGAFPQHRAMLDWVLPRLRPDQKFLCTEFSLIWLWKARMDAEANREFCGRHENLHPGMTVRDVINDAVARPWPYAKWEEFLRGEPWYMNHQNFIGNAMALYRETGRLEVATYCFCPMRDRRKPFAPGDTPWMLSALFTPSTVRIPDDGVRPENFPWAEKFRQAQ